MDNKKAKLDKLAEEEGMTVEELIAAATIDSVSPGICVNVGCSYTTDVEPDSDHGYCEACRTTTVWSALRLAGMI